MISIKLTDIQRRILFFLIGCIGIRLSFVYLAKNMSLIILQLMGILAITISIGLMYSALIKYKKGDKGAFGGIVWWNDMRFFHSITYAIFSYLALTKNQMLAWKILLFDVIIGLGVFIIHYIPYLI